MAAKETKALGTDTPKRDPRFNADRTKGKSFPTPKAPKKTPSSKPTNKEK